VARPEVAASKSLRVKSLFEDPQRYLSETEFNIRVRQETVRQMVGERRFENILDVGCGNGAISLPLLRPENRLTLVDVSSRMISIARSNVPDHLCANVRLINADLMAAALQPQSYDLILCLGVLAHVDSPDALIARVAGLMRPGGTLILEFTDSLHPAGHMVVLYNEALRLKRPAPYRLNLLSRRVVFRLLNKHGLKPVSTYRYGLWIPLANRFFSQSALYKLVRKVFGDVFDRRNSWLGNQYICLVSQ
jgi:2-polyprenyl-3-methyl-5-hydroxy-6-metoxy-1,4-benzoquinol methylase